MSNQYTVSRPFDSEQLRVCYESGMTQTEIAGRFGSSQKVVWKAMREAGISSRVAAKRYQAGDKNSSWKGNDASYAAFHYRVQNLRGKPQKCEVCETTDTRRSYDWANLTGKYDDPADYKRMCRSCHWKHDRKINNIHRMRNRGA